MTQTGGNGGPAPTVTVGGATKGVRGQLLTFTINATDSDSSDVTAGFTYSINWGDGHTQTVSASANNGTQTLTHVYANSRNYHIQATAKDAEGNVSTVATHNVNIFAMRVEADGVNSNKKDLFIGGTNGGDTIYVLPGSTTKWAF